MAWQFTCPLCKSTLIVLKSDAQKQARCPECETWVSIPSVLVETSATPNCPVKNNPPSEARQEPQEFGSAPSEHIEFQAEIKEGPEQGADDHAQKKELLEKLLKENPQLKVAPRPTNFGEFINVMVRMFPATVFLIIANVITFIVLTFSGVDAMNPTALGLAKVGANYSLLVLFNSEFYRLFTSMFIHAGILHLVFNLWILWSLGNLGERLFGSLSFALIYLISGLAGSMGSVFFTGSISCGASGAIFGLAGALLAIFLFGKLNFPPLLRRSFIIRLLLLIGANLVMGFTLTNIDNAAHIGGLLIGFGLGAIIRRPENPARLLPTGKSLISAASILAALVIAFAFLLPFYRTNVLTGFLQTNNQGADENKASLSISPEELELLALNVKLQLFTQMENKSGINETLQKIQKLRPNDPHTLMMRASVYLENENIDQALSLYQQVIQSNPDNYVALGNTGWLYYLKKDFQMALEYSQRAYTIYPEAYYARFNEAIALLRLNRIDESREKYIQTLELLKDSDNTEARTGAISDLSQLLDQGIMAKEVRSILKEIFQLQYTD
ncbi:MAG: rhomboid family intramembrane serine protease [Spirochaetales bacterium]|nr:rhomboid family intramembrane serine protease [Spirochaetales bacterium]